MSTPTPTPTPRTYAAWSSSFEPCEYRAAHTARTMRECSQQLETELAAERAIVSRIWTQLGSPTYTQLKGRSIYDLIEELKTDRAEVEKWQKVAAQMSAEREHNANEAGRLRAEVKSCGELSCDECNARTAALTAERDQLRAELEKVYALVTPVGCDLGGGIFETAQAVTALTAERDQLRAALALGQQNCDDAYGDLRTERDAANARAELAEAELAAERARLDSGQILLAVAGERAWHCGVDLRAAIDAGMRETAK